MIWICLLSLLIFLGSLVLVWQLILRLPVDYLHRERHAASFATRHPLVRAALIVVKNICGLVLVAAGGVMLVTPGQGVLCMLLGLTLLDFPGRHRLVCLFFSTATHSAGAETGFASARVTRRSRRRRRFRERTPTGVSSFNCGLRSPWLGHLAPVDCGWKPQPRS